MPTGHSIRDGSRSAVRLGLLLLAAAVAAGGVITLSTIPPADSTLYPRCQFHSLTGLHCPGCGTTRALHAVLTGRLAQALAYNPLAIVVLPVLAWALGMSLYVWYRRRPAIAASACWRWMLRVLAVAVILFGILRNLPGGPFAVLAPHELTK